MFKKVCTAVAVLAGIGLGAAGSAHAQRHRFDQPLPEDRDTILREIAVTPEATTVSILLRNTRHGIYEVCAQPTGQPEAFTLTDLDTGKVWKQLSATGLVTCGKGMDKIRRGARKTLTLKFPALPATARRLQLGENSCQPNAAGGVDYWCFAEVRLPGGSK